MSKQAVFCIANSVSQAEQIVSRLEEKGFASDDVSVLLPDNTGTRDFAHKRHTKAPEGVTAGVSTGGLLGGAFGWLVGAGALAIPGVGPLIAAGPVLAALSSAAVGAAVGGVGGALIGFGIPEFEAKRYEGKIKQGNILISVHAENGQEKSAVREIFEEAKAEDISAQKEVHV